MIGLSCHILLWINLFFLSLSLCKWAWSSCLNFFPLLFTPPNCSGSNSRSSSLQVVVSMLSLDCQRLENRTETEVLSRGAWGLRPPHSHGDLLFRAALFWGELQPPHSTGHEAAACMQTSDLSAWVWLQSFSDFTLKLNQRWNTLTPPPPAKRLTDGPGITATLKVRSVFTYFLKLLFPRSETEEGAELGFEIQIHFLKTWNPEHQKCKEFRSLFRVKRGVDTWSCVVTCLLW